MPLFSVFECARQIQQDGMTASRATTKTKIITKILKPASISNFVCHSKRFWLTNAQSIVTCQGCKIKQLLVHTREKRWRVATYVFLKFAKLKP
jgi:hypothetical protein